MWPYEICLTDRRNSTKLGGVVAKVGVDVDGPGPRVVECSTERSHVVNSIFAASASFSPAAWWSRCLLHLSVRTPKNKAWLCSSPAGCKANSNDCANRSRLCICVCNAGALMPSEASTKCCKKGIPSSKIWTTELRYHNRNTASRRHGERDLAAAVGGAAIAL